jgi:uncharacterized protein (TIGR02646 family)
MNIGFENIVTAPAYPPGVSASHLAGLDWGSQALVVLQFKTAIKRDLREAQVGRCCYCRRVLFDDIATHIEHFIEKAQYAEFTFEIQNLALSCGTCNTQKNGRNKSLAALLKKRADREGKVLRPRCQTLCRDFAPGSPLPSDSLSYRWVHPHFDRYSVNIQISKGWVFVGKTFKGTRTIRGANLNALALIERRALSERLTTRGGMLSLLVGLIAELDRHRAREVAVAVVKVLRRRRGQNFE